MINLNEKITENFTYREFIYSDTAIRLGIDNYPKDSIIWKNIKNLAVEIQKIRNKFGQIRILSGYRCPELNKAVNGSATSLHCFGFSADLEQVSTNIKLIEIINWIHDNLKWRELICEYFPRGWCHYGFTDNIYTTSIKLKDKNHNYSIVSLEYLNKLYN
jgi:hypothetical protein